MTDTDLEQRLHGVLARASDGAPSAEGLTARVRARRSRSRRTTVGVGAVLAAAAAVVAIAVMPPLLTSGDAPVAQTDPPAGEQWRTVTVQVDVEAGSRDVVELEVPGDWERFDASGCGMAAVGFGPEGLDPCDVDRPLTVFGSALYDPLALPGEITEGAGRWSGYVLTGDLAVSALDDQREVVRRVLASVRLPGEPVAPVEEWTRTEVDDPSVFAGRLTPVTVELPRGGEVGVRLSSGIPDCSTAPRTTARRNSEGQWVTGLCRDRIVSVRAPTQALADVVVATIRGY